MKGIIYLIFAFGSIITGLNAQQERGHDVSKKMSSYQIGDKVEDFSLVNTEGTAVSLSHYNEANGYLIVFTSNVCPFAIASEKKLVQLQEEMSSLGYLMVAINSNVGDEENLEAMKSKAAEANFSFPYLKDDASVYSKFGATKTPHVFLLDKEMRLRYMGSIDDSPRSPDEVEEEFLLNAISALENNQGPDPAVTKSIGCPIKRGGESASRGGRKGPPSPEALMERMDANNDGKISREEAKGPLANDFDRLDSDKNGQLTVTELSKHKKGRPSH